MPVVCQRKPTRVPQRMRVHLEGHPRTYAHTLDHSSEAGSGERGTTFGREDERRLWLLLSVQTTESPQLVAHDGVRAGSAALHPADVEGSGTEINLFPPQV